MSLILGWGKKGLKPYLKGWRVGIDIIGGWGESI
jgi:hypothetical protein